jgi:hypothetical protein
MNHWDYFLFLLRQAHNGAWCITVPLLVLVVLAICKNYFVDKTPYAKRHLIAFVPFVFPLLLLVYGTLFEHTSTKTVHVPEWQTMLLWVPVISQVVINGFCLAIFKGMRLSVLALTILQGWLTLIHLLVAAVSITGISL